MYSTSKSRSHLKILGFSLRFWIRGNFHRYQARLYKIWSSRRHGDCDLCTLGAWYVKTAPELHNFTLRCFRFTHFYGEKTNKVIAFLKTEPKFSSRYWKCNETNVAKEYCWAITGVTEAVPSFCGRSDSSVFESRFKTGLPWMYTHNSSDLRKIQLASDFPERSYCVSWGALVRVQPYLLTYLLTYLVHGAESFLRS